MGSLLSQGGRPSSPTASLLFEIASMFTRRPTGSSSDHSEWTPMAVCYRFDDQHCGVGHAELSEVTAAGLMSWYKHLGHTVIDRYRFLAQHVARSHTFSHGSNLMRYHLHWHWAHPGGTGRQTTPKWKRKHEMDELVCPDMLAFCRHLPKAELHAHLNGCVRPETIRSVTVAAHDLAY